LISCEKEVGIHKKLNDYLKITDNINKIFRSQKTSKTRMKLYHALNLPTLLHGSENWIIKARDAEE
jgi:hypothetical protein